MSESNSSRRLRILGGFCIAATLTFAGMPAWAEGDTSQDDSAGGQETVTPSSLPAAEPQPQNAHDGQQETSPFSFRAAKAAGTYPRCESGYLYSVSNNGGLNQIASDGSITNLGAWNDLARPHVNGLAIGDHGSVVYAYQRSGTNSENATVLRYTPSTNMWESLGPEYRTGNTNALVTGAVDLSTGKYLFGGFNIYRYGSGGNPTYRYDFRIYEFDPATNQVTFKGSFDTGVSWGSRNPAPAANGDMAFDAAGNLYVVRSGGGTIDITTVTAAALSAANGGSIPASKSATISSSTENVNGIAFDADGTVYLGNASTLDHYDPSTWSKISTVTSNLPSSTDLASCNSPATLTLQKYVQARGATGDQFALTISRGAQTVSTATTAGNEVGVQLQQVGPVPAVSRQKYTIRETAAGTTNLSAYTSTWRCTNGQNGPEIASGSGPSGEVTIPAPVAGQAGASVNCVFTNKPKPGAISWQKVDSVTGEHLAGSSWKLKGPNGFEQQVTDNIGAAGYAGLDAKPAAGDFLVNNLAWGQYTIEETTAPEGYIPVQGVTATFNVTAETLQPAAVTISNDYALQFRLKKVGYVQTGQAQPTPLEGASFIIRADSAGQPGEPIDNVVSASGTGTFDLKGLTPGAYWLEETQAPEGHNLLAQAVKFTVVQDAEHPKGAVAVDDASGLVMVSDDALTITVSDTRAVTLPISGGIGTLPYALGGFALLLLAALGWGIVSRRAHHRR